MADRRGKDPSGAEDPIGKNAEGGDDEDEEDEEEEEEPKLKYERIGNALTDILNQPKDAASCMAVHQKFLALGTHWGVVHVLDHQGNNIRSKEFPCHTSVVNEISIDNQGEYIASCSDEGRVVINGLYSTDNNMQNNFDRPIKAVAIDPDFSKKNTKMYVAGGDKLILMEKGWWIKSKSTVLHVGEGTISTIKWRSHYIAWANDVGVKVFDLSSKKLITHIKRDADSPRSDLYRCNLCWKDDVTLLIGWAKSVKVCVVKERPHHDARAALPSRFVEIVALFNTDYYISGIAPLKDDLVILSYVTEMDNTDSIKKTGSETAQRPQLRILATRGIGDHEEISADALSVRGFNKYRCNDYSLENVAEESLFYIISPRDIVLAKPRDMDDHITWLLEHEKFEEAMEIAESHKKLLKKHNCTDIGKKYLKYLMEEELFEKAASMCLSVLQTNKKLWEDEVYKFAKKQQLQAIAPFIPTKAVELNSVIYEMVLNDFLHRNYQGFAALIKEWPHYLYDNQTIIKAIQEQLKVSPNDEVLLHTLGELYTRQRRYDLSLSIYLQLGHKDIFELIHKHDLFGSIQDKIVMLMEFDSERAVKMLLDNIEKVPVEEVVAQLSQKPELLLLYLDTLFLKDTQAGQDFHEIQVSLYAEYDGKKLLSFLKNSNYYPLQKALQVCEQRHLIPEMVYLLSRMGNTKQALHLIIEELRDVEKAIEFAKEQDDEELWEDLITYSLDKPDFIRGLLHNIGTHVDPIKLIEHIPEGLEIPGLRDSLVKILQDYNLQISLREGCDKILVKDCVSLIQRLNRAQQKGVHADGEQFCPACNGSVIVSDSRKTCNLVVFFCKHIYHEDCLSLRDTVHFCQICTANSHIKKLRSRSR